LEHDDFLFSIVLGIIFNEQHDTGEGVMLPGYVDGIAILATVVVVACMLLLGKR
jgi:hypothetical protein